VGYVINKCMEKDPETRYQSARDLLADLKRIRRDTDSGKTGITDAASLAKPKRLPATWALIAAGLAVVLVAVGLISFWPSPTPATSQETIDPIAVLPFVNAGDEDSAYLSDGIPGSISSSLSRLAGDPKLAAQTRHLLSIQQPGNEPKSLFHDLTLLPWHDTFSLPSGESVTHVSGMKCYPSLGKGKLASS
jgi:hypothetical protein